MLVKTIHSLSLHVALVCSDDLYGDLDYKMPNLRLTSVHTMPPRSSDSLKLNAKVCILQCKNHRQTRPWNSFELIVVKTLNNGSFAIEMIYAYFTCFFYHLCFYYSVFLLQYEHNANTMSMAA